MKAVEMLAQRECDRAASWGHGEPWDGALHPETRRSYLQSAREDLQVVVPLIRNQERQRIQEALLSDRAIWAAGARLPGSEHDTAEDWAEEAIGAALDTLDPPRGGTGR